MDTARQELEDAQNHLCFLGSGSEQSCSNRTPCSYTIHRVDVFPGTVHRLYPFDEVMSGRAVVRKCTESAEQARLPVHTKSPTGGPPEAFFFLRYMHYYMRENQATKFISTPPERRKGVYHALGCCEETN